MKDPSGTTTEASITSQLRRSRDIRKEFPPPSWDTFTPLRRFQPVWVTLGMLFLLPGLAATYLRVTSPIEDGPAMFASFISYGVLAYLGALVFLGVAVCRARRKIALGLLTGVSAVLLAYHLAWIGPLFVGDHRAGTGPGFTIMSLNMLHGSADPRQVAAQAAQADIVVLVEATPESLRSLRQFGWKTRFPYAVGDPDDFVSDAAVYSRFPLSEPAPVAATSYQQWVVTAAVPGIGAVRVITAHPCNPFCGSNKWAAEHDLLRTAVLANLALPLVVAGDFNAVDDHAPMRQLRRDGLESATDIVGAGWLPTYPSNRKIPPLLPIDHILLDRQLTATSMSSFWVAGTDHRGLIARIVRAQ